MRRAVCALIALAAVLGSAASASAGVSRLKDPARADSGWAIESRAAIALAESPYPGTPLGGSPGWFRVPAHFMFAQSALNDDGSHRFPSYLVAGTVQLVNPDGSLGTRYDTAMQYTDDGSSDLPVDPKAPGDWIWKVSADYSTSPCLLRTDGRLLYPGSRLKWLLPLGEHQVRIGIAARVNAAVNDGHPYSAARSELVTVSCTKERRAYR